MRRCLFIISVVVWCAVPNVYGAVPYAFRITDRALNVDRVAGAIAHPLIRSIDYEASFTDGPAFRCVGVAKREDQEGVTRLTMALEGPAAGEASVVVAVRQQAMDVNMKWTIRYSGPAKEFNGWNSGFRLEYAQPILDAQTVPVTKFVRPTGEKPYEVKGDAPYRDTEMQLREVTFQDARLVMATRWYDPDWIYGHNLHRAAFMQAAVPKGSPTEITYEFSLFPSPANNQSVVRDQGFVADIAAAAAGRPISLSIVTRRLGNLFKPGETVRFVMRVRNVTAQARWGSLDWKVWDYYGKQLVGKTESLRLAPDEARELPVAIRPDFHLGVESGMRDARRGVLFLDATLRMGTTEWIDRTTFGILPDRPPDNPKPGSPFGLAGLIASPLELGEFAIYPDQHPMDDVLQLAHRIGARWLRGGGYSLKVKPTAEEERQAREQRTLLTRYGMSLHAQIGSGVPKPEEVADFKAKVRGTLSQIKEVTPYVEVGNELNYAASAQEYVERMLHPIHDVTRELFPDCKIMTMGFGGVGKDWLDAFVKAGGMNLVDVLSVHPGSHPRAPEFWEGWRGWVFRPQMLDALEAARNAGGKEVWITEVYAPTPPDRSQLDVRTAADYLVRTYVVSLALGVRVIEWYQFQDGVWFGQRPKPDDVEYNFGMVYTDLTPKPGYIAYGVMTEQLEGARYVGRLDLGAEELYGVRFHRGGESVDVLWSYREKHEVDLAWWPPEKFKNNSRKPGEPWIERWHQPVSVSFRARGRVALTDIMGNRRRVEVKNGMVTLNLTGSPVYVTGLGDVPVRKNLWQAQPVP